MPSEFNEGASSALSRTSDRLNPTPSKKSSQLPSSAPRDINQATARKLDAATSVATGADNSVADVLERARQKADAKLEGKKEELSDKLADRMVEQELTQVEAIANFFINQWGDTDRLLKPYQAVLEAEVIEV